MMTLSRAGIRRLRLLSVVSDVGACLEARDLSAAHTILCLLCSHGNLAELRESQTGDEAYACHLSSFSLFGSVLDPHSRS